MINFNFFDTNLLENGFWVRNFEKLSPDPESAAPRYLVCQFSGKKNNFDFLHPNLPKKHLAFGILKN